MKVTYKLPILNYSYDEFEPYIDAETMYIHYTKHHQTYVNNINNILKSTCTPFLPIEKLIMNLNSLKIEKKIVLCNNAGGHFNHILFWKGLKKDTSLKGNLKKLIEEQFGSFEEFQNQFNHIAVSLFGSGWIWLILKNNRLSIVTTVNQDNPLMKDSVTNVCVGYPIIALDVWEHAYYLRYKNKRIDYIKSFWKIINWDEATHRFDTYKTFLMNN